MTSSDHLHFGTAGIRGRMGPGPQEINSTTMAQVATGMAAFLRTGSVVIGYDGRRDSDAFARLIATVLTQHGLHARLLPAPLPTPVLAASVRTLDCAAGIMVTASHNPAADNGVKVYLEDGRQIIPPVDGQIAALIAAATPTALATDAGGIAAGPIAAGPIVGGDVESERVVETYINGVVALCPPGPRALRIAHTALHGVGWGVTADVLARAGFTEVSTVGDQRDPDPAFPTAPYPNPEIPGVLDHLLAHAANIDADLAIAHDPDADRCAAAVRSRAGRLEVLSGDDLGALLGWWIIERIRRGSWRRGTLASSVVSSTLLGEMAESAGLPHVRTLTGFKWIARVPGLVYGYEEALGYCVAPDLVADKDGISAALVLAEACAELAQQGRGAHDVLDDLARRHGRHLTGQRTVHADAALIAEGMHRVRTTPPTTLAGRPVIEVRDYALGVGGLPSAELIGIEAGDVRVMVRPSGTEPLLKCYAEVVVRGDMSPVEQRQIARRTLDECLDDVMRLMTGR